ncbi:hypothetical protein SAMN04488502_10618 [Dendrosporobacter quercicolus]|uniref:Uncharacterized protein n=1 Tax=Dendrosporobacter quercicolus TaxID=146817 RepID=A0A1G9UPJ5_9FIRM|nr:hypothetical protein SAMN04488502_10618 [Dendrosporobacter quercicolus]
MIFVIVILWSITVILAITNRTKQNCYLALLAFLCGLGGLSVLLEDDIIPFI